MPEFTCATCREPFRADALSGGRPRTYCSRGCMRVAYRAKLVGPDNPAWRGGKWKYRGRRWRLISEAIIARDETCRDCGGPAEVAHHLIPQRFWLSLDAANCENNLVALCHACHAKRPEHYWPEIPDALFDPSLHARRPPERNRARLKPRPRCAVCGARCRRHRSRFCSYTCSNRARWRSGVYGPGLARNFGDAATARWKPRERSGDIETFREPLPVNPK